MNDSRFLPDAQIRLSRSGAAAVLLAAHAYAILLTLLVLLPRPLFPD